MTHETIWVFLKLLFRWAVPCDFLKSTPKQYLPLVFMLVVPLLLGDLSDIKGILTSLFSDPETSFSYDRTMLAAAFTFRTVSWWAAVENSRGNSLSDGWEFPLQRGRSQWGACGRRAPDLHSRAAVSMCTVGAVPV